MAAVPWVASLLVVQTGVPSVGVPSVGAPAPPYPQIQTPPWHPHQGVPSPAGPLHPPFQEGPSLEGALLEGGPWVGVPLETQAAYLSPASLAASPQVLSAGVPSAAVLLAGGPERRLLRPSLVVVPSEALPESSPAVPMVIPGVDLEVGALLAVVPVLQLG